MEGFQRGGEEQGDEGTEKKQHNQQAQNRWREMKNGIGNRELKELICTTHGHELRGERIAGGQGVQGGGGKRGGKLGKLIA